MYQSRKSKEQTMREKMEIPDVLQIEGYFDWTTDHSVRKSSHFLNNLFTSSRPGNERPRTWRSSFMPNPSFKRCGFSKTWRTKSRLWSTEGFSCRNEKISKRKTCSRVAIWRTAARASCAPKVGCHSISIPTTFSYGGKNEWINK